MAAASALSGSTQTAPISAATHSGMTQYRVGTLAIRPSLPTRLGVPIFSFSVLAPSVVSTTARV